MSDPWLNDDIQFPRLIAEAEAAGAFTTDVIGAMASSMDLSVDEVLELLERAGGKWDAIVFGTPSPHGADHGS